MAKILLLGDTITANMPNELIGTQDDVVINEGLKNTSIGEYFQIIHSKIEQEKADIIVLQIGTDEMINFNQPNEISNKIMDFISKINRINCKFIVQSLYPTKDHEINKKIKMINDNLSEYCYYLEIEFLDIYDLLLDESELLCEQYTDDGIHPNYTGYSLIANQINELFLMYNLMYNIKYSK